LGAADGDGGARNFRGAAADGGNRISGAADREGDGGNSGAAVGDDDGRSFGRRRRDDDGRDDDGDGDVAEVFGAAADAVVGAIGPAHQHGNDGHDRRAHDGTDGHTRGGGAAVVVRVVRRDSAVGPTSTE